MLKSQVNQSKVTQRRPNRGQKCLTEIRDPYVFSGIWTYPLTLCNADPRVSQFGPKIEILEVNLTLEDLKTGKLSYQIRITCD
jgi:hypothetical protein